MVKDEELVERLQELLRTADLDTATATSVRRALEEHFGVDLSDRKAYIRQQIHLFLETHQNAGVPEAEPENVKPDEETDNEDNGSDEEGSEGKRSVKLDKIKKNVKKRRKGFSKPCALSPQLQKLVGEAELARTEVVKKIWAYIKEKDLQYPKNKRKILCDETLHGIFRVKSIDMFQMNKALTKHIWPLDEEDAPAKPSKKKSKTRRGTEEEEEEQQEKEEDEEEGSDEPKQKRKRLKGKGSGFLSPLPISDALANFFGTGDSALARSEVVKRMWEYIKRNDLQDPSDKRRILCDDKLRELFEVDSFNGFTVSKLLTAHFIKHA